MSVSEVERLVEQEWANLKIDPKYGALLQEMVEEELRRDSERNATQEAGIRRQLEKKRTQRQKLLEAYYAGAIMVDLLKTEQVAITKEIEALELRLAKAQMEVANVEMALRRTLEFLYNPAETYRAAPPHLRKQLNQAAFDGFEVFNEKPGTVLTPRVAQPFKMLLDPELIEAEPKATHSDAKQVTWESGMPSWFQSQMRRHRKPKRPGVETHGREGWKMNGLAVPTGFEPVSPP